MGRYSPCPLDPYVGGLHALPFAVVALADQLAVQLNHPLRQRKHVCLMCGCIMHAGISLDISGGGNRWGSIIIPHPLAPDGGAGAV